MAGVHGLPQPGVKSQGRKVLQSRHSANTLIQWIKKPCKPNRPELWIIVPWESHSSEKSVRL